MKDKLRKRFGVSRGDRGFATLNGQVIDGVVECETGRHGWVLCFTHNGKGWNLSHDGMSMDHAKIYGDVQFTSEIEFECAGMMGQLLICIKDEK